MTFEERQARLEQVMTALAEAQVKTEDALEDFTRETKLAQDRTDAQLARTDAQLARTDAQLAQLGETMNALATYVAALATHVTSLAQAQTKTEIQFQAYLNTRKN